MAWFMIYICHLLVTSAFGLLFRFWTRPIWLCDPFGLILPLLVYITFICGQLDLYYEVEKKRAMRDFLHKTPIFTSLLSIFKCLQHALRCWNNPDHVPYDITDHVTRVIPEFALSAVPSNHANIQSRLLSALQ